MIESANHTADGSIAVVIDGAAWTVPDDPANRHRAMLAAWEAEGNTIAPYEAPPPDLSAYAARRRWEREVGGIVVGGVTVHTDDRSKMLLAGARMAAEGDTAWTTEWKAADGTFVTLDAGTIVALSNALLAHVAACFAVEATVLAGIAAGTITSTEQIDVAFEL